MFESSSLKPLLIVIAGPSLLIALGLVAVVAAPPFTFGIAVVVGLLLFLRLLLWLLA